MSSELPVAGGRPPGMFLSHAHEDKAFVRRLARDLRSAGVRVWIDEAEMGGGDSLLEKITGAISEVDYLGVVISPHSGRSDWFTREVEIAMRDEVAGRSVKVLPLLLRGGELPPVLIGKLFADFRSAQAYPGSLEQVLTRLGIEGIRPSLASDRISELASASPLLGAALAELRAEGLSNATADALVSAKVADVELSEFLSLAVQEMLGPRQLFGLALSLPQYIDERGVGQEALDFCLRSGRLEAWQMDDVGTRMLSVKNTTAVLWCHSRLTSLIKDDSRYQSFLARHIDTVVDQCYDDMAAYLLHPNRGPMNYNIYSFALAIGHLENPVPFQTRWIEWIRDGYFDRAYKEDVLRARILYLILNDQWGEAKFNAIVEAIHNHVYHLMKSEYEKDHLRDGMYHLAAMVDARYRGADYVLERILSRVNFNYVGSEEVHLFQLLSRALEAVVAYNLEPSDELDALVSTRFKKVADADRSGITGYWGTR